jgi:hypothetical protein
LFSKEEQNALLLLMLWLNLTGLSILKPYLMVWNALQNSQRLRAEDLSSDEYRYWVEGDFFVMQGAVTFQVIKSNR